MYTGDDQRTHLEEAELPEGDPFPVESERSP
jgi:hypothetical protein